mgnify:CR=1 FL=1
MDKLAFYRACMLMVLFAGYFFYYITRRSINFMRPHFNNSTTSSLNLTKYDIGIIISSQNLAYAISKFVGGILTDTTSSRVLFGSGLFLSGLLNIGFRKEIKVTIIFRGNSFFLHLKSIFIFKLRIIHYTIVLTVLNILFF